MTHLDALNRAQDDLARLLPGFPAAHRRLLDADQAQPGAASYDPRGSSAVSPTERLALTTDPTEKQRRQLTESVKQICYHTRVLALLVQEWTPHAPTARDRAQVERANDPTPECAITRDLIDRHEPVHRTTDCGGVLPQATPVGRWVYDFIRTQGRTPTVGELERHHKGLIVRVGA